jgi:hypothetical protein
MCTYTKALPSQRLEQSRGCIFGGGKEEVDDLDKLPSVCVCAARRRSTSSLGHSCATPIFCVDI